MKMLAMLLLSRIILAEMLSLLVVAHCVNSNVVNGEDDISRICCVYENCSYNSLDQCLANLTSNVLINITTDVTLSSIVRASNLSNVSIIGHDYPSVNCNSTGGIHFMFCHNCSIQGITNWDGCGSPVEPGLKFSYSSNVTIENCSFQCLLGQAVVLLGVLGDVNICDCKFISNSDYKGHGSAIQFSSNDTNSFQHVLTICNCNFSYNTMNSLIYLGNALKFVKAILVNSTFYRNQGISLYAMHSRIHLIGRILFKKNSAENGTGIYIKNYCYVIFDENSEVTFIQNSANGRGGAVFLTNHSICLFDHNSNVTFNNNHAANGIVYSSVNSNVMFKANSEVIFRSNIVDINEVAIYPANNSHVTSKEDIKYISVGNGIIGYRTDDFYYGSIIYSCQYSNVSFEGNSTTVFSNNTAADYGGGIYIGLFSNVFFQGNSHTVFSNNTAEFGGGIFIELYSNVSFQENSNTVFSNNTADYGGGIYIINSSNIFFQENSNTVFNNNTANNGGGIFIGFYSNIFFQENSITVFSNNTADNGGGIYIEFYSNISFQENSNTVFSNNTANYEGGIYITDSSNIFFGGNFNTANSANYGGGIYIFDSSNIFFQGNSTTVFSNNTADYGGGIYISFSNIFFQENSTTVFSSNIADYGGGIYIFTSSNILFQKTSTTVFSNNTAYTGSIDAQNNCSITFDNNATVTFNITFGKTVFSDGSSKIIAQGNFSVTFNDHTAKWCNNTCLPYTGPFDSTAIDSDGIVWCNKQRGIYCSSDKCNCKNLEDIIHAADINASTPLHVNISDEVVLLSSQVSLNNTNISIMGHNNTTVLCVNGGGIQVLAFSDVCIKIKGVAWIRCGFTHSKSDDNFALESWFIPAMLSIQSHHVNLIIQSCSFRYSIEQIFYLNAAHAKVMIIDSKFKNSGAIQSNSIAAATIFLDASILVLTLKNCHFDFNEGSTIVYIENEKNYFTDTYVFADTYVHIINSIFSNNKGVSVKLKSRQGTCNCTLYITGEVLFENNVAENGAGISIIGSSTVMFGENSNATFVNNSVDYNGAVMYLEDHSNAIFESNSLVTFANNKATNGIIYAKSSSNVIFTGICQVTFNGNSATQYGSAIYSTDNSSLIFSENATVMLNNNNVVSYNGICTDIRQGGTIFSKYYSYIVFKENCNIMFNGNQADFGAAIYSIDNSNIIFYDKSTASFYNHTVHYCGVLTSALFSNVTFADHTNVTFNANTASQYSSAIYSTDNSHFIFTGNATVMFSNNNVMFSDGIYLRQGGTIFSCNCSLVSFEENSDTVFKDNQANFGAAICSIDNSSVVFKDRSTVLFNNHIVNYCGVLTSASFSNVTFADHTNVTFSTNTAFHTTHDGYESSAGAICTFQNCNITFSGNSSVTFINNRAVRGGAVLIDESSIIIEEYSTVTFYNNFAWYSSGGALICSNHSYIVIKDDSNVTFNSNKASGSGGAIHSNNSCKITFKDNSTSTFISNTARYNGGALFAHQLYAISFEGNSQITFTNNTSDNGGALYFINSFIRLKGSLNVSFYNNLARLSGGVGYCNNSTVMIEDNAIIRFEGNMAENAGALYIDMCNITFKNTSTSSFIYNTARDNGGAILSRQFSTTMFVDNSTVKFNNNRADNGGALYFDDNSYGIFSGITSVSFHHNTASYGVAIFASGHCNITLTGSSSLLIAYNEAMQCGGGGYLNNSSNFMTQENASLTVDNNKALQGAGICVKNKAKLLFKDNSNALFYKNIATVGGGAIRVSNDSIITISDCTMINFTDNKAQYGGAIFLDTNAVMINNSDNTGIYFINNTAKFLGNLVYQEATWLCNGSCKNNRTLGISSECIATPPNELKFYHPAICINEDNDMQCKQYYVRNVMLGKEIAIPACVLDYYNHNVHSTQFRVQSEKLSIYNNNDPNQVLISCNQSEVDVNITGNQSLSKSINFTINFTLNVVLTPNWKHISVNLIIELSPCYPGFWHYPNSMKCECYNDNDVVVCSDNSSMIKRGYWFGNVTGKPTVVLCPINYCNFTCCETSNGYYQLSPVRDNQCKSHRSGTACGSCEEGYTLSFDSTECLDLNECAIGQTILVLALILLYWIVIIVVVFSLMRFKVEIGYLYAITYYYSVVDLLLNQNWYLSSVLDTTINVISSTAKIIPQYLGKFCFIKNMSGIDQQFIHYIHPVAVSLFLVMITILARRSRRLASFISKGIIRVICYLLLLSYTSVATTSLLLMRPLLFLNVDKVYTYVSPNIEYLHGRHLPYAIVAMLFTIVIVIGLPLVLGLEPFLNSKINFVKIKPLLDQFQGCYKDKYRCFAAYYMICRLVIITIIIANSSNNFVLQYSLIAVCVITALIHQILKPYSNSLLNDFDGAILQLLILCSALTPFVEFIDDSDTTALMGITFVIVMLPLLIFIIMSLMINKENIKKIPSYCYTKCSQIHLRARRYNQIPVEVEESADEEEYVNVIDDSRRINATICDV